MTMDKYFKNETPDQKPVVNKAIWILQMIILLLLSGIYFFHFYGNSSKIAFVDAGKLFAEYKGMQIARQAYQKKMDVWQANIDTLTMEVQNGLKKYEKEQAYMTKRERDLSQELLNNKQRQLVDYQRAIQQKAQEEDQHMTTDVVQQINGFLMEYGKSRKFRIIFAATNAGNIVYAEDALDITVDVVARLNKKYDEGI
jgi:outer membrane protein